MFRAIINYLFGAEEQITNFCSHKDLIDKYWEYIQKEIESSPASKNGFTRNGKHHFLNVVTKKDLYRDHSPYTRSYSINEKSRLSKICLKYAIVHFMYELNKKEYNCSKDCCKNGRKIITQCTWGIYKKLFDHMCYMNKIPVGPPTRVKVRIVKPIKIPRAPKLEPKVETSEADIMPPLILTEESLPPLISTEELQPLISTEEQK